MSVSFNDLKLMMYELTDLWVLLEKFIDEVRRLSKRDESIIVSGFDDTVFSRKELLENEPLLKKCYSDEEINKISMYHIGIPHILGTYYNGKNYPKNIVETMVPERDFFLSSGFEHVQKQKLAALWLDNFSIRVSADKREKVLNLIQHVLYELKYIPAEITVYDNDIYEFDRYRVLIESVLTCKLKIIQVEMDGNNGYTKMEEIKTDAS